MTNSLKVLDDKNRQVGVVIIHIQKLAHLKKFCGVSCLLKIDFDFEFVYFSNL